MASVKADHKWKMSELSHGTEASIMHTEAVDVLYLTHTTSDCFLHNIYTQAVSVVLIVNDGINHEV